MKEKVGHQLLAKAKRVKEKSLRQIQMEKQSTRYRASASGYLKERLECWGAFNIKKSVKGKRLGAEGADGGVLRGALAAFLVPCCQKIDGVDGLWNKSINQGGGCHSTATAQALGRVVVLAAAACRRLLGSILACGVIVAALPLCGPEEWSWARPRCAARACEFCTVLLVGGASDKNSADT